MAKNSAKRIGLELPTPRGTASKKPVVLREHPGSRDTRGTASRTEIRREASATQHASRASVRTPERSGQKRSHLPAKKK